MAWNDNKNIWYWDRATTDCPSTNIPITGATGGNDLNCSTWVSTTGTWWVETTYILRIWVTEPDHWTDEDGEAWMRLVNIDTKTGWRVVARIKGKVCIADPNDEIRPMDEFVPLMKAGASDEDLTKIEDFYERHPLTPSSDEN